MSSRLSVNKTYKQFIAGGFERSESGRSYPVAGAGGELLAHAVQGSRKDVRDAVAAARSAQSGWAGRTAYNRGQILYRVAEVMESRRDEFCAEVLRATEGCSEEAAATETATAIDRWVWYAGWADKFPTVLGGANPVAGPYFNLSVPEPTGVVGIVAPDEPPLLPLVSRLAPVIVSGNTAVVLASECCPLAAITLAETLALSDVPAGVVNIITGHRSELVPPLAGHVAVDSLDLTGCDSEQGADAARQAAATITRVVSASAAERQWADEAAQSPYLIDAFCETKTVWHPKGR
ncbi:MAG: aldehyde dehydrogenase [Acidimicrobiia bacterium]|nr:aldehyde dehydrogenase [Acidimicrobiia bacterium]MYE72958.1 aldehyde dehydrogenase [Acidimicrobiia bacterium]MYH96803.1 aldehyde dehydrogenase [Acidimicrobiia bacterium]MYJ63407.1 aldehyde dehydrogenase [Acidimicrobiia bacterium]